MKWFLTVAALGSLSAGLVLGTLGHLQVLWAAFVAALFLLVCANADRIAELSATRDGITAKTRDLVLRTEGAITEIQMLGAQLAAIGLSLIKRQGRMGGYAVEEEERLRASTLQVVRRLGVPEAEILDVMREWHAFEDFDYVQGILGNSRIPSPSSDSEMQSDWRALRKAPFDAPASPETLRAFLVKHQLLDPFREALLEDYEYYRRHRKHRRPDLWAKHELWPPIERGQQLPGDHTP